jgi:hypothetical protein
MMIAEDQFGDKWEIEGRHPRKELLALFGRKHADKIWRDRGGTHRHVGYKVAGLWLELFEVKPWEGKQ